MSIQTNTRTVTARTVLSKVPEVTIFFWIIKILATTIGETAADFLATNLNLGLTGTTVAMSAALAVVLVKQFRARGYVPVVYWLSVVLLSVVGTLITDNLVDNFHVALRTTTAIFSVVLAITFVAWYRSEKTLSIHSIYTPKREGFYWLTILFTFALGTAAGDLIAETLNVGYWKSALLFGGCIGVATIGWRYFKVNAIFAFWAAYILTRPLGASIGDYLSQAKADGGLALGTTMTSVIFLVAIAAVVAYLTKTKKDQNVEPAGAVGEDAIAGPVPDLESDARVLETLRTHGQRESAILESYRRLVEASHDQGIRYLGRIIIEDEERRRHVIAQITHRIDSWVQGESIEPSVPPIEPRVDPVLLEETHRLIELEHGDAKELRLLERELRYAPRTSLLPLLVKLMLHDTSRHIEILQFIRSYTG